MVRQVSFRILMSLLLLFSQQIATSHVLSHWTSSSAQIASLATPDTDSDTAASAGKDQSCNKCLMLAQFGAPLGNGVLSYAPPELPSLPVDGAAIAAFHARTILAFQSRAPPHA